MRTPLKLGRATLLAAFLPTLYIFAAAKQAPGHGDALNRQPANGPPVIGQDGAASQALVWFRVGCDRFSADE
jgi:hypothetical protein